MSRPPARRRWWGETVRTRFDLDRVRRVGGILLEVLKTEHGYVKIVFNCEARGTNRQGVTNL